MAPSWRSLVADRPVAQFFVPLTSLDFLYAMSTAAAVAASTSPYRRLEPGEYSSDAILSQFRSCGFCWLKLGTGKTPSTIQALKSYAKDDMGAYERKWTVENRGKFSSDNELGATQVLGCDSTLLPGQYYVSTIISGEDRASLSKLFQLLPFESGIPPVLGDSKHDSGCWLFIGSNPQPVGDDISSNGAKRKRDDESNPLVGRAEHVDEVEHSGTWHMQLSGSKTWLVRPDLTADWGNAGVPDISGSQYHEISDKKAKRLRIKVEEGDLFVLNTAMWYHRTELQTSPEMSISLARDFFLPAETLLAKSDFKEGEIILEEDALPDIIPSSDNPNCALAEVESEESSEDGEDDCSIVLVALRDISAGEELTIAKTREGESIDGDDKCNAPDAVDPRSIATHCARKGDILLRNEEIPEELFCSPDPSCEIVEDGNDVVLRALRDIIEGEVFSVTPQDGIEYEEIEVDTTTGELVKEN